MSSEVPPGPQAAAQAGPAFGHGFVLETEDRGLLAKAIDAAFDYRGDVTLRLVGGGSLAGYISNRDLRGEGAFFDLWTPDAEHARRILLREVRGIAFTGKDTASGKSWETWIKNYRARKEARARGEASAGAFGLFPDPLDDEADSS